MLKKFFFKLGDRYELHLKDTPKGKVFIRKGRRVKAGVFKNGLFKIKLDKSFNQMMDARLYAQAGINFMYDINHVIDKTY
jgi:hypothetical protein